MAFLWITSDEPLSWPSVRNFCCSSTVILVNFFCIPSNTRIACRFVSITTSSSNLMEKWELMVYQGYKRRERGGGGGGGCDKICCVWYCFLTWIWTKKLDLKYNPNRLLSILLVGVKSIWKVLGVCSKIEMGSFCYNNFTDLFHLFWQFAKRFRKFDQKRRSICSRKGSITII